jgi:hypothetical protein
MKLTGATQNHAGLQGFIDNPGRPILYIKRFGLLDRVLLGRMQGRSRNHMCRRWLNGCGAIQGARRRQLAGWEFG